MRGFIEHVGFSNAITGVESCASALHAAVDLNPPLLSDVYVHSFASSIHSAIYRGCLAAHIWYAFASLEDTTQTRTAMSEIIQGWKSSVQRTNTVSAVSSTIFRRLFSFLTMQCHGCRNAVSPIHHASVLSFD